MTTQLQLTQTGQTHSRQLGAAQAAWLVANGCDELQGNYFSLPVPAAEFARLYARGKTWHLPPTASAAHAHGS